MWKKKLTIATKQITGLSVCKGLGTSSCMSLGNNLKVKQNTEMLAVTVEKRYIKCTMVKCGVPATEGSQEPQPRTITATSRAVNQKSGTNNGRAEQSSHNKSYGST